MKSHIGIIITSLISFSIFSSSSFAGMGAWSKSATSSKSQTCTHITRNSGRNDSAVLSIKHTPDKCTPNGSPVEPNCIGLFGTDQVKISINRNNGNSKVKTQIIMSNDWLKISNPNFPISMIFNSTLKRGETKKLAKIVAAPGSKFACRIGT
ncbi:MAG: hypothetical protein ACRBCS_03825 [Cellvibrionaceae bacterium]